MDNYPMGVYGGMDYFNPPDPPKCDECGAELELDWSYCPYCGCGIVWVGESDD